MGFIRTLVDRVYRINNSWLGFHKGIKKLTLILWRNLFPVHIEEKVINVINVKKPLSSLETLSLVNTKFVNSNILNLTF